MIAAAGTNTTLLFDTFLTSAVAVTGSYELLGFLIVVGFIYFVFTNRLGREATILLSTFLVLGLAMQGFINQIVFYLAIVVMAFFVYRAYTNFGRRD